MERIFWIVTVLIVLGVWGGASYSAQAQNRVKIMKIKTLQKELSVLQQTRPLAPRNVLLKAKELEEAAAAEHCFAPMLQGIQVAANIESDLDPLKKNDKFVRLDEVSRYPWLTARDKVILNYARMQAYLHAYRQSGYTSRWSKVFADMQDLDSINPAQWSSEQYVKRVVELLDEIYSSQEVFGQPLDTTERTVLDMNTKDEYEEYVPAIAMLMKLADANNYDRRRLQSTTGSRIINDRIDQIFDLLFQKYAGQIFTIGLQIARVNFHSEEPAYRQADIAATQAVYKQFAKRKEVLPLSKCLIRLLEQESQLIEVKALLDELIGRSGLFKKRDVDEFLYKREELLVSHLSFRMAEHSQPGQKCDYYGSYRNLEKAQIDFYALGRLDIDTLLSKLERDEKTDYIQSLLPGIKPIYTHLLQIKSERNYLEHCFYGATVVMPSDCGYYAVKLSYTDIRGNQYADYGLIQVTEVHPLIINDRTKNSAQLLYAASGHPLANMSTSIRQINRNNSVPKQLSYSYQWDGKTNPDGFIVDFPQKRHIYLQIANQEDKPLFYFDYLNYYGLSKIDINKMDELITLWTDRAIYRLGQQVAFSGILYQIAYDPNQAKTLSQKGVYIEVKDANGETFHKTQLETDANGVFSGTFTLPTDRMMGQFSLEASSDDGDDEISFRVEEYKRPTFEVLLDTPREELKLEDSTAIKGKAKKLSGVPLTQGKVEYTVKAIAISWGRFFFRESTEEEIASGTLTELGSNGEFIIPVQLKKPQDVSDSGGIYYFIYTINAKVIDSGGETQQQYCRIFIGDTPVRIKLNAPQNLERSRWKNYHLNVNVSNSNWEQIEDARVSYRLINKEKEVVDMGEMDANKNVPLVAAWSKLPSGEYTLEVKFTTKEGFEVLDEVSWFIFSEKETMIPSQKKLWAVPLDSKYADGEDPVLLWGTSAKDKYVYYKLFYVNGQYKDGVLRPEAGKMNRLVLPAPTQKFREQYRNVYLYFVDEGKLYEYKCTFNRIQPDKSLTLQWKSFRNRMLVGSQETWSLRILDANGKPVTHANLAAWMTDASLDLIYRYNKPQRLDTHIEEPNYFPDAQSLSVQNTNLYIAQKNKYEKHYLSKEGAGAPLVSLMMRGGEAFSEILGKDVNSLDAVVVKRSATNYKSTPVIRTNFAEQAYFYPQLHTDKNGEVSWQFTLPESLTRWRVELFAHTSDVMSGGKTDFSEAYKEFMIEPNIPRFLRMGDKAVIGGTLRNLSDKVVKGTLRLELFDPETEKILQTYKKPFDVNAKGQSSFSLPVTPVADYDAVGLRIIAEGNRFSDGEQHLIPQLPGTKEVIETIPFRISSEKTQQMPLGYLFPSGKPNEGRLYINAVGNPLFLAMSQLLTLAETDARDAISLAASAYSLLVADYLTEQSGVKTWMAERRKSLAVEVDSSALQRNEQLKQQTLQQTPWVRNAQSEEARTRALLDFMYKPKNQSLDAVVPKLSELQEADGRWKWYPGMEGSYYLTSYIITLMTRAQAMGADMSRVKDMMKKGQTAFDQYVVLSMQKIQEAIAKKEISQPYLPWNVITWYYLLSLDTEWKQSLKADSQKAYNYFKPLFIKQALNKSLTEMPETAIALLGMGKMDLVKQLAESLVQHLTSDEEHGAFFAMLHTGGYWWTDRDFTTHTGTIDLLRRLGGYERTVAEMQRWLLGKKRTTQWATTTTTTDAIYALMGNAAGENKLQTDNLTVEIPLKDGGKWFGEGESVQTEIALRHLSQQDTVLLTHHNESPIWGGISTIYPLPLERIQASSSKEIQVRKEYYTPIHADEREKLRPLKANETLKLGQTIVTVIYLTLDRAMDFVSLHDMRPGCMEPMESLSGYRWGAGTGYYMEIRDGDTRFYFNHLNRGEYRLQYEQKVVRNGEYNTGIATAQSTYAPEYTTHTGALPSLKVR